MQGGEADVGGSADDGAAGWGEGGFRAAVVPKPDVPMLPSGAEAVPTVPSRRKGEGRKDDSGGRSKDGGVRGKVDEAPRVEEAVPGKEELIDDGERARAKVTGGVGRELGQGGGGAGGENGVQVQRANNGRGKAADDGRGLDGRKASKGGGIQKGIFPTDLPANSATNGWRGFFGGKSAEVGGAGVDREDAGGAVEPAGEWERFSSSRTKKIATRIDAAEEKKEDYIKGALSRREEGWRGGGEGGLMVEEGIEIAP